MSTVINPEAKVFLGLNNALDPCSYEYVEGSAFKSDNSRIDESGRWAEQPVMTNVANAPTAQNSPITGGNHVKRLPVAGTDAIIQSIPTNTAVDVGPNKYTYAVDGSANRVKKTSSGTAVTPLAPPIIAAAGRPTTNVGSQVARTATGSYWYMFTYYDLTHERESLPSIVYPVTYDSSTDSYVSMQVPVPVAGYELRIYRSRRTYAAGSVYNPTNIFYYIDKVPTGVADDPYSYIDYMNDEEIVRNEYEGRGATPPKGIDYLVAFNNRMLYFDSNVLYWSSAGRPEEVAQNYILGYWHATDTPAYDLTAITDQGGNTVRFTSSLTHTFVVDDYVQITRTDGWDGLYKITAKTSTTLDAAYTGSAPANETQGIACKHSYTVTNKPLLSLGYYAEAKYEIAELSGLTVKAAFLKDGRLWCCTDSMIGYIEADRRLETYRFRVIREGIGAVNDKVIARTPYGVFGADRRGIWQLDNRGRIKRISDGVIDIKTNGKSTALTQSYVTDSFGVWLPNLEEYWWSIQQDTAAVTEITGDGTWATCTSTAHGYLSDAVVIIQGSTNFDGPDCVITKIDANSFKFPHAYVGTDTGSYTADKCLQIVYQANRDVFVGPYSHTIFGGTNFVSASGSQAYLNDMEATKKDSIPPTSATFPQALQFWFGQPNLSAVKKQVKLEVLYASITSGKTVAAKVYQNNIASTTNAEISSSFGHTSNNLVGLAEPTASGRMFMLELTVPYDCEAPILAIDYQANLVVWTEKARR